MEEQGYKSCLVLLKLSDAYSVQRLEQACQWTLAFTERPSLKSIQAIPKSGQDKIPKNETNPEVPPPSAHGFTRGREYYLRKEED